MSYDVLTSFMPLLAQANDAADALPFWGKYVLGPLGVLVLLLVYMVYTEKFRLPRYSELIKAGETKLESLREKHESATLEAQREINKLRSDYEDKLNTVRQEAQERMDRANEKMLRLAVRVQRAVEALAGLEPPEVESYLDEDE